MASEGRELSRSEREFAEQTLSEGAQRLRFFAEAGRLLGSTLDYEATLGQVCRLAVPVLADWCALDLLGDDGRVRRLGVAHTDPAKVELAHELWERYPPRPDDPGGLMKVLRTGEPVLFTEVPDEALAASARDADHLRILRALGPRSGAIVPLIARGRTLGALTLVTAESGRVYGPEDLAAAQELAVRAALAVDNARLYAEARQALDEREAAVQLHRSVEEQLTLLVEASASLSSSLEPSAVLGAVLALSRRLVAADAYAVWRYRDEDQRWGIDAAEGLSESYQRMMIRMMPTTPHLPGEPVVAEDVAVSPQLGHRLEAYQQEGIRALLAVPLRIHQELCGTLVFYYRAPHRFTPVEQRVATALGNLASSAISTAELYEAQRRMRAESEAARQRLAFLAEASAALAMSLNEEVTLQSVASLAVPDLADWCVVDLLAEDGSVRRFTGRHSDPAKDRWLAELLTHYPDHYWPGATSHLPEVLRTGRPEVVHEVPGGWLDRVAASAGHVHVLRQLGLGSYMIVPLTARRRILGSISFCSVRPHRYDSADLRLAEDLARRAALAVDNARLYREAREADRRKDEFLAMLAHELRNPLAPLRNALHLLELPDLGPDQERQVRARMGRQVEHLVRMVDDLLDVSRLLRGKIELRAETIDVADVVARAVETAQPVIDTAGHELTVTLPDAPLWVGGDRVRLAQVLANLLTNAAKYTERAGRITLTAADENGEAVVRVRDTGVGIAPELLPRVFDLFVQGDRSPARSQGGLGIGLTLVRRLVELHNGSVQAHSDGPGRGSEFVVRLPAVANGGRERPDGNQQSSIFENHQGVDTLRSPHRRRILVVDDNIDAAESLALLLRAAGHVVRTAPSGPAAMDEAATFRPEAVVLDIGLPGMDGYEVARRLRGTPQGGAALLVALTGYGQDTDRHRSQEAGFDHHLTKPADPGELLALLAAAKPNGPRKP